MDRREFLKVSGGSLIGLSLTGVLPQKQVQTMEANKQSKSLDTREANKQSPTNSLDTRDVKKREFYLKGLIDYGGGGGAFDGERVLAYRHKDGSEVGGVFQDYLIKDGMLRVEIAGEDKGLIWVVLPQQLVNNSNMLCVEKEQIYVA